MDLSCGSTERGVSRTVTNVVQRRNGCARTFSKIRSIYWEQHKRTPHFHRVKDPTTANRHPEARTGIEAVAATIEEVVTAIRLEAERRDLGAGTIVISAARLRQILRGRFLAQTLPVTFTSS